MKAFNFPSSSMLFPTMIKWYSRRKERNKKKRKAYRNRQLRNKTFFWLPYTSIMLSFCLQLMNKNFFSLPYTSSWYHGIGKRPVDKRTAAIQVALVTINEREKRMAKDNGSVPLSPGETLAQSIDDEMSEYIKSLKTQEESDKSKRSLPIVTTVSEKDEDEEETFEMYDEEEVNNSEEDDNHDDDDDEEQSMSQEEEEEEEDEYGNDDDDNSFEHYHMNLSESYACIDHERSCKCDQCILALLSLLPSPKANHKCCDDCRSIDCVSCHSTNINNIDSVNLSEESCISENNMNNDDFGINDHYAYNETSDHCLPIPTCCVFCRTNYGNGTWMYDCSECSVLKSTTQESSFDLDTVCNRNLSSCQNDITGKVNNPFVVVCKPCYYCKRDLPKLYFSNKQWKHKIR